MDVEFGVFDERSRTCVDMDDSVLRVGADWSYDTHTETHKCKLCGKPMSIYYQHFVGAEESYYCDNYRCPLSWKFRAYLTGRWKPVEKTQMFGANGGYCITGMEPQDDPGTLM